MTSTLAINSTEQNEGILILISDNDFFSCLKTLHLAKTIGE